MLLGFGVSVCLAQVATPDPRLVEIAAGNHRAEQDKARDKYRNPVETLTFFGLKPDMHVVEIWPGRGWYTDIIAPYVKDKGKYYAADRDYEVEDQAHRRGMMRLRAKIEAQPELLGKAVVTTLSRNKIDIPRNNVAPPGTADMVLTFRNVHNWMKYGYEREVFDAMFRALKPGGVLGVVEHRADPKEFPDPQSISGYVQEEQVKELAKAAGFVFVKASEVNANPRDTRNHPKGVWTLPPALRLKDQDRQKYLAIGESDRMTLMFRKP
jgi:predicted methyltransferase